MLRRAFTLLAAACALAACVAGPDPYAYNRPGAIPAPSRAPGDPGAGRTGDRVAVLLPLTGPNAEVGQAMLRAVQLAFRDPASPALDPRDTGGTPAGAAAAARAAVEGGAGILLGPLTAQETAAAAPVARAAGLPVLAFTSDPAQAQPGVWTLGITPAQQVRRLVQAAQAEGRTRFAAVVPDDAFGNALANGLLDGAGSFPPRVERYAGGFPNLNAALRRVADHDNRRGAIEARQRALRATPDAPRDPILDPGDGTVPPPPFDALLLGATGEQLAQAVPLLAAYDIGPQQTRILGPALWARDAGRLGTLSGAWYAAPDPAARAGFEQLYATTYGAPARDLTSLAFDAGGVARAAWDGRGFPAGALVRPEGFLGADGLLALLPDGGVRRGLAIFEIDRGGPRIVQPAPQTFAASGV